MEFTFGIVYSTFFLFVVFGTKIWDITTYDFEISNSFIMVHVGVDEQIIYCTVANGASFPMVIKILVPERKYVVSVWNTLLWVKGVWFQFSFTTHRVLGDVRYIITY